MASSPVILSSGGLRFQDGRDHGRILVFGHETDGRYSLMEYLVAPRLTTNPVDPSYGRHRHREIEETFFVRSGRLRFVIAGEEIDLGPGDFVRVPPGVKHGFANQSDESVELLVTFIPGGFEELFVRHRTDQDPAPRAKGFIEDAIREFGSEFDL